MSLAAWTDRLRRHLLADVEADITRLEHELTLQRARMARSDLEAEIARLQGELAAQRAALANPDVLRPLIAPALGDAAARAPEEFAAALRPVIEALLRERRGESDGRVQQRAGLAALAGLFVTVGVALFPSVPGNATVPRDVAVALAARPEADVAPTQRGVRLEKTEDGFGLGQSGRSDDTLAELVQARLSARIELAGAALRFAVKDGWIWVRGETDAAAQRAVGDALGDLGDDVVVVNQVTAEASPDLVARPMH